MWLWWFVFYLLAQTPGPQEERVDFKRDVQPILERRCTPCHFEGGKMHHELPFDDPGTIHKLGEKLFTRIRNEQERKLLRAFLGLKS